MASCKQDVSDGVTCMVNGFVYDVESKLPIEGATVSVGNKVGVTNEEGYFVVSGVGAGTYDVGIVKAGYIPGKVAQLTVNPGFFKEVRGEDLAYYRNQITADGGEDETRISVSGQYNVNVNPQTGVATITNAGAQPQQNVINSIGDATRYSQTIMGVALRPAYGVLTGSVEGLSETLADGFRDYYEVPDGTGIAAFYLPTSILNEPGLNLAKIIEDIEKDEGAALLKKGVMAFRSVVNDGSFTFTGLPNGFYAIVVDPFLVEGDTGIVEIPQSACYHKDEIIDPVMMGNKLLTPVISGYGEAGTVYAVFDDALVTEAFKLLSVMVVPRADLPIESARDIDIATGDGLVLEFNKVLDENYEDILIEFDTGSVANNVWTWSNDPLAGTKYVIENNEMFGFSLVYVWNDEFSKDSLANPPAGKKYAIHYKVSSVDDGDVVNSGHFVDSIYHADLAFTDLYDFDYYGELVDGVFDPDDPIVITFDEDYEFPENAYVGAYLLDSLLPHKEVECYGTAEDNRVTIWPEETLEYGKQYYLSFKVFSEDEVVLYSSIKGLDDAKDLGIVKVATVDEKEYITFTTAVHSVFNPDKYVDPQQGEKYLTNLDLTAYDPQTKKCDHGDAILEIYQNPYVFFNAPVEEAYAFLKYGNEFIPVDVEIDEDVDLVTVVLDDDYYLFPGKVYKLELVVTDYEGQDIEITNNIAPVVAVSTAQKKYVINDNPNGLESFKIESPAFFDSKPVAPAQTIDATFYWKSEGIHFGEQNVYFIYKLNKDNEVIAIYPGYAEKSKIVYQYDKEFNHINTPATAIAGVINVGDNVLTIDELAFGGTVGFVLVSYDELGRLIQSPIIWVEDEVAPKLVAAQQQLPLLPAKDYAKDETRTFYLKAESNELLKYESDLATWTGDVMDKVFVDSEITYADGHTLVKVTVTFGAAVTLKDRKDLTIEITASDTSGNYSEIFTVFPSQNN